MRLSSLATYRHVELTSHYREFLCHVGSSRDPLPPSARWEHPTTNLWHYAFLWDERRAALPHNGVRNLRKGTEPWRSAQHATRPYLTPDASACPVAPVWRQVRHWTILW